MLRYLVSRIAQAVGIVLGTAAITFVLLYLVPADPAALVAGRSATHEQIESVRHEMGLDRSLPVQFGSYLLHLAEGDFGTSYVQRSPVSRLLLTWLPATLLLLTGAIIAQLAIGLTAGIIAAVSRGGIADRVVMIFAFVGVSTPRFVMGILLLYAFAVELNWFPIGGYGGFSNLVLPALTIGVLGGGWYSRMMRSSLMEVMHLDYIRTARAKGAGEMRVVLIDALRNAFLPILRDDRRRYGPVRRRQRRGRGDLWLARRRSVDVAIHPGNRHPGDHGDHAPCRGRHHHVQFTG